MTRSGYYNYLRSADKRFARDLADAKAASLIKKAFRKRGFKKGSRSIKMTLEQEYHTVYNLKRIRRLMHKFNILRSIKIQRNRTIHV
ncbi:IS3 family transposase [Paenibacillus sp. ISL-20]|uniref:IS3 family transposase n=1 Tax=Paenibacillus sp. ISL-20 TaxID=2819163 RepID=UPI00333DA8F7